MRTIFCVCWCLYHFTVSFMTNKGWLSFAYTLHCKVLYEAGKESNMDDMVLVMSEKVEVTTHL